MRAGPADWHTALSSVVDNALLVVGTQSTFLVNEGLNLEKLRHEVTWF